MLALARNPTISHNHRCKFFINSEAEFSLTPRFPPHALRAFRSRRAPHIRKSVHAALLAFMRQFVITDSRLRGLLFRGASSPKGRSLFVLSYVLAH